MAIDTVEIPSRFVGQEQGRLDDQGSGHGYPLLFAAGEGAGNMIAAPGHAYQFEHFPGPATGFGRGDAVKFQRERDVFLRREDRQEVERLEDEADPLPPHQRPLIVGERGQVDPFQEDFAARRRIDPPEH